MLSSFKSKIGNAFCPIHLWGFSNSVKSPQQWGVHSHVWDAAKNWFLSKKNQHLSDAVAAKQCYSHGCQQGIMICLHIFQQITKIWHSVPAVTIYIKITLIYKSLPWLLLSSDCLRAMDEKKSTLSITRWSWPGAWTADLKKASQMLSPLLHWVLVNHLY